MTNNNTMELDIFKNYTLQREELLARVAQSLQLDATRKAKMESAYNSVGTLLNNDTGFFKNIEVDIYPQGSVPIGATNKPLNNAEFDLDIVLHIKSLYTFFTPIQIYNELVKILSNDDRYKDKIEKKKRCVRLKYANEFHMDIMPGCIKFVNGNNIMVPDRELKNWVDSNPKGFIEWFLKKSKSIDRTTLLQEYKLRLTNLKAAVEDLPDDDFYNKTPLQRSVQLAKRYRDIFFENDDTYATSSIVLTTLMGQYYNGENSIYQTIENILKRIRSQYQMTVINKQRFKVFNPVNNQEDFTDKWEDSHYLHFYNFINSFYDQWNNLKVSFEFGGKAFINLFGEGVYKKSLQDQIANMSKYSTDLNAISNGLIISGNALTDRNGNVNTSNGYKNDKHRNFGELYNTGL